MVRDWHVADHLRRVAGDGPPPSETLLVSNAAGNFGSATVALALSMGARRVACVAIMTLRQGGRAVLMGGGDLALPYSWIKAKQRLAYQGSLSV